MNIDFTPAEVELLGRFIQAHAPREGVLRRRDDITDPTEAQRLAVISVKVKLAQADDEREHRIDPLCADYTPGDETPDGRIARLSDESREAYDGLVDMVDGDEPIDYADFEASIRHNANTLRRVVLDLISNGI